MKKKFQRRNGCDVNFEQPSQCAESTDLHDILAVDGDCATAIHAHWVGEGCGAATDPAQRGHGDGSIHRCGNRDLKLGEVAIVRGAVVGVGFRVLLHRGPVSCCCARRMFLAQLKRRTLLDAPHWAISHGERLDVAARQRIMWLKRRFCARSTPCRGVHLGWVVCMHTRREWGCSPNPSVGRW